MRTKTVRKTGPNTPAGKARVSQNALKHGIFSGHVLLAHEDPAEFEALREEVYASLQPVGFFERVYADQALVGLWRLRRAVEVETANMDRVYEEVHAAGAEDLSDADRHRRALVALLSNRYADNIHGYATKILHEVQRAQQRLEYLQLARSSGQTIPFGTLHVSLPSGRSPGRPRTGTKK